MSRIGGIGLAFPFTSPQINGAGGEIMLQTGGIYYVPQGNYLAQLGAQTVAQWWDPNGGQWRTFQPSGDLMQISSDGSNYRLVNMSGVVIGASITNAGSGGTNGIGPTQTGSTVSFTAPVSGGVPVTATGYVIVGGSVQAPTVTQAGSGFLVPPLILIDPPPQGGVQATATATLSSTGTITGITMVNVGAGYTSSPNFYIVPQPLVGYQPLAAGAVAAGVWPPPGLIHPNNVWPSSPYQPNISSVSGALLTPLALTGSGTLTGVVMMYGGGNYDGTHIPTVSFGGTSLGAAAATAIMSMCCTAFAGSGGSSYVVGNPWISSLGLIAANNSNNTFLPRPARGVLTSAAGAGSIEDPGFGLQKVPTIGIAASVANGTGGTFTPTVGGVTDVSILQQAVQ